MLFLFRVSRRRHYFREYFPLERYMRIMRLLPWALFKVFCKNMSELSAYAFYIRL